MESCKISIRQEQSVKVNAFLICRDPQVAVSARDFQLLFTQRVGAKLGIISETSKFSVNYFVFDIYPYTMDGLKSRCRKGLQHGTCFTGIYHNMYHS